MTPLELLTLARGRIAMQRINAPLRRTGARAAMQRINAGRLARGVLGTRTRP